MEEYRIITAESSYTLSSTVQQFLHEGWQLYGPMTVTLKSDGRLLFAQPIIKKEIFKEIKNDNKELLNLVKKYIKLIEDIEFEFKKFVDKILKELELIRIK